ncbi:E3 ubiquitin-protein ligase RNF126-like isoform X2 [Anneissia japonica]|uniref:E3 ubiquitin-protein ligase RNF126-like isoform X1 n=1 Tax=Anneissia japonica TaxID=1529436 RepID=UPI0014256C18|nr:E3 ubiquitin-protein ligase RNF126-like isoform X1 [Anneissia japonica]XP_033109382.1 E3 ubiquitin-protein ligase RNF126-like isoform X2 [Anneissia japonica]
MAEAVIGAPHFFCHNCKQEINSLKQDYTCPRCSQGFVEELESGTTQEQNARSTNEGRRELLENRSEDSGVAFHHLWNELQPGDSRTRRSEPASAAPHRRMPFPVRVRQIGRDADPAQDMIMILQHLLGMGGVGSHPFPIQLMNLHGRPGDYAWGERGLDTIITQLLSNLEGGGPPPAEKTDIQNIPTVKITKADVDENSECAVCKEEYTEYEEVRKMPCEHLFHSDCIIPWLEMHNTCPVCRKSLDGRYTRNDFTADEDGPPDQTEDRNSEQASNNSTTNTIINDF